jgi:hypothetical protein
LSRRRSISKCLLDDGERTFGEAKSGELVPVEPGGAGGVVSSGEGSAEHVAEIVDENVMVFDLSGFITHDALEDFDYLDGFDDEAGFFEDLAPDGLFEGLADFEAAAGERPVAL